MSIKWALAKAATELAKATLIEQRELTDIEKRKIDALAIDCGKEIEKHAREFLSEWIRELAPVSEAEVIAWTPQLTLSRPRVLSRERAAEEGYITLLLNEAKDSSNG